MTILAFFCNIISDLNGISLKYVSKSSPKLHIYRLNLYDVVQITGMLRMWQCYQNVIIVCQILNQARHVPQDTLTKPMSTNFHQKLYLKTHLWATTPTFSKPSHIAVKLSLWMWPNCVWKSEMNTFWYQIQIYACMTNNMKSCKKS